MPLYEYECDACHERFERIQKYSDPLVDVCPKCGKGPVRKLLSSPAVHFKGSGFYITDYPKKSSLAPESHGKSDKSEKSEKSEKSDKSSGSSDSSSSSSSSSSSGSSGSGSSGSTDSSASKSSDKKN
jgi:putative FmdB family regulatory protein